MDSEHEHVHDDDVVSIDSDGDSKLIDNNDTDDTDFHGSDNEITSQQEQNYTILNEEDVFRLQEEDITRISTLFTISKVSATILLQHYNWNDYKVQDAWCADEEKVCREVGLLKTPVVQIPNTVKKLDCGICFETYGHRKLNAAACGHPYCRSCWTSYISTSISDGPGCLMLRCPEPSCRAAVGQDMINMLASDEDKHKYSRYLLRSYIENNRKIKWCPAPGCAYAVDFVVDSSANYDVSCKCSYGFCWNCTEEAHRPVDCNTVGKWIFKNLDESENTNWILANSKPCPKCKRPIEKNQGCMNMTCRPPCNFHFCWLCLDSLSNHIGYGTCNGFKKGLGVGGYDEAENRREMAKRSIERYTHYYERWAANHSSRKKAVADLKKMQSVQMKKLSDIYSLPETQLQFITEAWLQVIECRRMLKWTYAYGYYLPEHEHTKKQFFEYQQGEAESGLEKLHHCAEEELQGYLNSDGPSKDFNEFHIKLKGLTKVTRDYFENLVRGLENGLSDVKLQQGAGSKSGSSKNLGSSKVMRQRNRELLNFFPSSKKLGSSKNLGISLGSSKKSPSIGRDGRGKGISTSSGPWRVEQPVEERVVEQVEEDGDWYCEHCTYANKNNTTSDCQMCNLPRYY